MTLPKTSRPYRPDIDGLRAIAVLLVLIFHFRLVPAVTGGFTGVDVFFVISGFLITSIIRAALADSTFDLRGFYVARVRRLAPALIATLAITAMAGALLLFPADLRELMNQILASQAYVANIYYWRSVNYFGLSSDDVFLLHTWSLAVEEQFYLFYPLLLIVLARTTRRRFWVAVALLALASFALNAILVRTKPEADFYLLPTRAWELLIGAIATQFDKIIRNRHLLNVSAFLGLGLIALGATVYRSSMAFPGFFALMPTLGAALLLGSGSTAPMLAHRMMSVQPLRYVGKISYPLYLVHWPIIVFFRFATGSPSPWPMRLGMFVASFAMAGVIYHFVETPVRNRRFLATSKRLLATYGVALAGSVALFLTTSATQGWPQRFPPESVRLAGFESDRTEPLSQCEYAGRAPSAFMKPCRIGKADVAPEWLVFGDSHAWASHDAFDQWLAKEGRAGVFVFRHSCMPVSDLHLLGDDGQCRDFNDKAMAFLHDQPAIRSVLLVSTWRQPAEQRVSTDEHLKLDKAAALELFRQRFAATVARIHDMGRRVYIWEPVPGARKNVPAALARANLHGTPAEIDFSKAEYLRDFAYFFGDVRENAGNIDGTFSPADVLCPGASCVTEVNGDPVYFDNSHLTRSSAGLIAGMLERGPKRVSVQRTE